MKAIERLNDEIQKREQKDAVRTNLVAVKEAIEGNKKKVYLPEKNFEIMEATVHILHNACNISFYFHSIENGTIIGKLDLQ